MVITSIFYLFHDVFYSLSENYYHFRHICIVVCKSFQLTLYHTITTLLTNLRRKAFKNIVGKRENADNQYFLLFPQYFLPFPKQILSFEVYLICRLQMLLIWASLNFLSFEKSSDQSRIWLFGKELRLQEDHHGPISLT